MNRRTRKIQNPRGELLKALLRRGFPVVPKNDGIRICAGLMDEDFKLLCELLGFENRQETEEGVIPFYFENREIGKVGRDFQSVTRACSEIRWMPFSNRETGPEPDGHDSPGRYTWMGFKRNQFGARESLKNLEPGIALLVKVLPWFGVWTAMSCQGHLRKRNFNRPKLWFNGNFTGSGAR